MVHGKGNREFFLYLVFFCYLEECFSFFQVLIQRYYLIRKIKLASFVIKYYVTINNYKGFILRKRNLRLPFSFPTLSPKGLHTLLYDVGNLKYCHCTSILSIAVN